MRKYRMSVDVNKSIVNGILQGYKNYIEERKVKKEEMHISSAYAWVKGNHIDDQTAEECKELGINFLRAKAGYTWGYLQFTLKDKKSMFIIKNAKYFNDKDFPRTKGIRGTKSVEANENYLKRLSKINTNVEFPKTQTLFPLKQFEQVVSIFDDEILKALEEPQAAELERDFDYFYIITYEIDETFAISKIKMLMPNPNDNIAYPVADLSELIATSPVRFDANDYEVLETDKFDVQDVPAAIQYGIVSEEDIAGDEEEVKKG